MRNLEQALYDHELITLRVIGEWWELDLTGKEKSEAIDLLARKLAALDMQQEVQYLPPEESSAIEELIAQGGRAPVATFSRSHGEVRQMGPGRMEREEPWLDPVSPLEALWYRGFLYRAFDETAEGMLEFYYMPEELLGQFPEAFNETFEETEAALPAVKKPDKAPQEEDTRAVDDMTTLLAALRIAVSEGERPPFEKWLLDSDTDRSSMLLTLARDKGWLREDEQGLRPSAAAADWLRKGRVAQLYDLADAWSNSSWNELCHTPGLICEGEGWQNEPILARTAVLDALPRDEQWYALAGLVDTVRNTNPDFQRPDGNYDTWYIRDRQTGGFLTGFDAWDYVEGRLLRFIIQGPLNWLGLTLVSDQSPEGSFRVSETGLSWLAGRPAPERDEMQPIVLQADGSILVAHDVNRYLRFQVSRIAELEEVSAANPYRYRLTPASLALAGAQGITADRLLQFLTRSAGSDLPKSLRRSIERWSEKGVEGKLESVIVLRVKDAQILQTLRSNPKTRDFLGESHGDLVVTVKPGQWQQFRSACAQLGLLIDEAV